jgi:transposase
MSTRISLPFLQSWGIYAFFQNLSVTHGHDPKKPTMRWIFFNFQEITELITQKEGEIESEILNMEEVHWKILSLMGEKYENIYL